MSAHECTATEKTRWQNVFMEVNFVKTGKVSFYNNVLNLFASLQLFQVISLKTNEWFHDNFTNIHETFLEYYEIRGAHYEVVLSC